MPPTDPVESRPLDEVDSVWALIMAHKCAENAHTAGFAVSLHDELVEMRAERDKWRRRAKAWENADYALRYARALAADDFPPNP